jgi:hypothetical protein
MLQQMMRWILIFILSITFLSVVQAQENEVVDVINEAKDACKLKDYREASNQLIKALRMVNEQFVQELMRYLPEPFEGWEADRPEGVTPGLTISTELSVKRRYFKRGTGKSIELDIISNAAKIPTLRSWIINPEILKAQPGIEIIEIKDMRCISKFDSVDKYAEINMIIGSSILVIVRGFEAKDLNDVKKFTEKIKISEIENKFP